MKGFLIFALIIAAIVVVLRIMRRRELAAFREADMADFRAFDIRQEKQQADQQGTDQLMARVEAYAALNPDKVKLAAPDKGLPDPLVSAEPDPSLYRPRSANFDEVTRNMLQILARLAPQGAIVLHGVPLSDFVRAEKKENEYKLSTQRVAYLICDAGDLGIICGVQHRDRGSEMFSGTDFIRTVFGDINRPLLEFPVSADISEAEVKDQLDPVIQASRALSCPECDGDMKIRRVARGKHAGNDFWVCDRFPACRGVIRV